MENIISIIIGVLAGAVVSAILAVRSPEATGRKVLEYSVILLVISIFYYFGITQQNEEIFRLNNALNKSNEEVVLKQDIINNLKEKLLTHFEINKFQQNVLETKQLPAVPYQQGHEQLIADRRIATTDNAFYVAFSNYYSVKNQGANFQINFANERDDGENKININVSRFSIKRVNVGDYIYSFSIPDPITPESNFISLRITKELNAQKVIKLILEE